MKKDVDKNCVICGSSAPHQSETQYCLAVALSELALIKHRLRLAIEDLRTVLAEDGR